MYADCSYGASMARRGDEVLRRHYFGSLDTGRMVANSACLLYTSKIAVCGFSAGGHLALSAAVLDIPGETAQQRPNAVILGYPVITAGEFALSLIHILPKSPSWSAATCFATRSLSA